MWKKNRMWIITPALTAGMIALMAMSAAAWVWDWRIGVAETLVSVGIIAYTLVRLGLLRRDVNRYIRQTVASLSAYDREAIASFPLPTLAVSGTNEILYYNKLFLEQVSGNASIIGSSVSVFLGGMVGDAWQRKTSLEVSYRSSQFTVYVRPTGVASPAYLLFFVENTELKRIAKQYRESRPVAMILYIDNLDEVMQNARESERARLSDEVEDLLEDWMLMVGGILRRYDDDRFLAVMEQQYLEEAVEKKFDILDKVRHIETADHVPLTLSIGVSGGETMRECEQSARQALEMALGRGGDQVAMKVGGGYRFFGGVSNGVEKYNKVRTRVMAAAISEVINDSDKVLVMGHRFSDLDSIGSCIGMVALAKGMGKPAFAVTDTGKSMAKELINRYSSEKEPIFITPDEAMTMVTENTVLIITDTHSTAMVESVPLYELCRTVVVIDHHRKMVDHIENAILFYHEPFASSASEMVAEMVPYLNRNKAVSRSEAEALLAGIMLDTRQFVMRVSVRTFEAAAALRQLGADTVRVKRLFAGSLDMYRVKSEIVAAAEAYRKTAIAPYRGSGADLRIAAAQAADELLSVQNVLATFTLFEENHAVNISARSFGDCNVQLIMEDLGGGGHLMMAGAQMKEVSMDEAVERLKKAIDRYWTSREKENQ